MYGNDSTQVATLAATGAISGLMWGAIGFGVVIMAGIALITTARVLHHRSKKEDQ